MSDFFFKLKILYWLVGDAIFQWREHVLPKDLDSRYCCNGDECGCGGMTERESWQIDRS